MVVSENFQVHRHLGYNLLRNMVHLHVLTSSLNLWFETLFWLSTLLVIFHTSIVLQYSLSDPLKDLDAQWLIFFFFFLFFFFSLFFFSFFFFSLFFFFFFLFFFFLFFCCPINCADFRGTAPAPLVPASPTSGHTQGSFCIAAPPPEVHRKWRQIVGRLPSEGNTALLLSHFGGVQ